MHLFLSRFFVIHIVCLLLFCRVSGPIRFLPSTESKINWLLYTWMWSSTIWRRQLTTAEAIVDVRPKDGDARRRPRRQRGGASADGGRRGGAEGAVVRTAGWRCAVAAPQEGGERSFRWRGGRGDDQHGARAVVLGQSQPLQRPGLHLIVSKEVVLHK